MKSVSILLDTFILFCSPFSLEGSLFPQHYLLLSEICSFSEFNYLVFFKPFLGFTNQMTYQGQKENPDK